MPVRQHSQHRSFCFLHTHAPRSPASLRSIPLPQTRAIFGFYHSLLLVSSVAAKEREKPRSVNADEAIEPTDLHAGVWRGEIERGEAAV